MRILVVGAGATGGYFGGRLAAAGRNVQFLVRPARADRLRADGLRIVSPYGDLAIAPNVVTAGEITGPFDVILLTVKAFGLGAALEDIAPTVGPETMILPFLNGMRHLDLIAGRFDRRNLVGYVCKVATTLDPDGRILQLSPVQEIAYGELDGTASDRMARLDETMRDAGFSARLSTDIEREMWEKWTLLATLAASTCLLRGSVGQILAAPGGRQTAFALLDEVSATVSRVGRQPSERALAAIRAMLGEEGSSQTSSLYRDVSIGAPIEADQILGDLLARARAADVPTPLLTAAYAQLSIYEAARRS
ncbi:ketopantoate reductase family protein [Hansschlegelia beijingensis]|uniref:ketopantoate reductase family protein n=1 Tax=Hansschlegelia beijingensis TaxID=1133344 RepID=UPI00387F2551